MKYKDFAFNIIGRLACRCYKFTHINSPQCVACMPLTPVQISENEHSDSCFTILQYGGLLYVQHIENLVV
jgi:hypothetical protein